MIKKIGLFLFFTILVLMTGCSADNSNYKALFADFSQGDVLSTENKREISLSSDFFQKKDIEVPDFLNNRAENEVIDYEYTSLSPYYSLEYDRWVITTNDDVENTSNNYCVSQNGNILLWSIYYLDGYKDQNKGLSYDTCFNIAERYLFNLISDGEEYHLSDNSKLQLYSSSIKGNYYEYVFCRTVGDNIPYGNILLQVNTDGEVVKYDLREYIETKDPPEFKIDQEAFNSALDEKIKEIYSKYEVGKDDYEITEKKLVRLKDGEWGVLCDVEVKLKEGKSYPRLLILL